MNVNPVLLCFSFLLTLPSFGQAADITKIHFPPRAKELQTSSPSLVTTMNYQNVSSLLTSVLEVFQIITAYKNELVITKSLSGISPPHEHCFIPERNLSNFTADIADRFLLCDRQMVELLSLALQRMIDYDKCRSIHTNPLLPKIKSKIDAISRALANITAGRRGSGCGLKSLSDLRIGYSQRPNCRTIPTSNYLKRSAEPREEDRSRPSRLRRRTTPTPTTSQNTRNPREAGDIDPTDLSFLNFGAGRGNRGSDQEATPTASSFTCPPVRNDRELFTYTYEVWIGLYYVQVDLTQKRRCLE